MQSFRLRHLAPSLIALAGVGSIAAAEDSLPKTLRTVRGKLMASEDFASPPAAFTGKPVGFASGFQGWRYNNGGRSGKWEIVDGTFRGMESPEAHHPATTSYGIDFKNAVIQVDVRLDDVPAEGRQYRSAFVKTTDAKDYVTALFISTTGINGVPYSPTRINPESKQRDKDPMVHADAPIKLNEWHTVVVEVLGDEMVGSLDGKSVVISNPLVGSDKHSVMLGSATQTSFRHFRIWEASPNPDWEKNRAALPAGSKPAANTAGGK